jgi:hypothetical protein
MAHQLYWDFVRLYEGGSRWHYDKTTYRALTAELDRVPLELTEEQRARNQDVVEDEIRTHRLPQERREDRLRELEEGTLFVTQDVLRLTAVEDSRIEKRIPGEPRVLADLLKAKTAERVRTICADAYVMVRREVEPGVVKEVQVQNWPISLGSVLPIYLSQYSTEFIVAKDDVRFPKSHRSTSRRKQLWFLSRALAGAVFGVSTRTAINLVGSKTPEQMFDDSRFGKSRRKQKKQRRKS